MYKIYLALLLFLPALCVAATSTDENPESISSYCERYLSQAGTADINSCQYLNCDALKKCAKTCTQDKPAVGGAELARRMQECSEDCDWGYAFNQTTCTNNSP